MHRRLFEGLPVQLQRATLCLYPRVIVTIVDTREAPPLHVDVDIESRSARSQSMLGELPNYALQ